VSESQVTLAPSGETKTQLHPGWTDGHCS